ncbi:hypothetical protein KKC94_04980 [Patescibacteria group bacterium]|nr:hypothetical protein [Patescibacteria group bacterium]
MTERLQDFSTDCLEDSKEREVVVFKNAGSDDVVFETPFLRGGKPSCCEKKVQPDKNFGSWEY